MFESLNRQVFTDWEIVLVDDGSTDGLNEFLSSQSLIPSENILFIRNEENIGPFASRRKAFSVANGEYVICIDADDELVGSDSLSTIYRAVRKSNSDVVMFNITRDLSTGEPFIDYGHLIVDEKGNASRDDVIGTFVSSYSINNLASKAIRRELLVNRREGDRLMINEDRLESFLVIKAARKFILVDKPLYYYRETQGSTTKSDLTSIHLKQISYVENIIHTYAESRKIETCKELKQYLKTFDHVMKSSCLCGDKSELKECIRYAAGDALFIRACDEMGNFGLPALQKLSLLLVGRGCIKAAFCFYRLRSTASQRLRFRIA